MTDDFPELPEECWELIFSRLAQHLRQLEPISLTCKRFLAITNRLVWSLTLPSPLPFSSLNPLVRFPNLIRIDVSGGFFRVDLDRLLRDLSASGLRLQALDLSGQGPLPLGRMEELGRSVATLKRLICSRVKAFQDRDVLAIADSFPNLEELDVSYPVEEGGVGCRPDGFWLPGAVSDAGVEFMSRKLRNLRSLDLSGNYCISDRSLVSIASNCASLRRIAVLDCGFVSSAGVAAVLSRCRGLVSLSVNGSRISSSSPERSFLFHGRELQSLDLSGMVVSDELLFCIGDLSPSLRRLILARCPGLSFPAVSVVVRQCHLLEHLDLEAADFLTDESVKEIGFRLADLKFISLSSCRRLTNASFRTVLTNATNVEEIRMEKTDLGMGTGFSDCKFQRRRVRRLRLGWNKNLGNGILREISGICGEIEELSVNDCLGISGVEGMGKLQILHAGESGLSDDGLEELGRSCRRMTRLDVEGCLRVTEKGVKEVVRMCKGLREVNLSRCGVGQGLLSWMVVTRPSLKRIVPPCDSLLSESRRESLLIRHGCLLCGAEEWRGKL